jgi:hypothetical protein
VETPCTETLERGDEQLPWLRLPSRQVVQRNVGGYLMRHRVAVVLVSVPMLLGAALRAHTDTRSPAADPAVRLTLSAAPATGGSSGIGNITTLSSAAGVGLAADYLATTPDSGMVDVVGIVGPGLSTVSFSPARVASGDVTTVTLAGVLSCDNDGWWTATDAEYRVRVLETDGNQRTRGAYLPLAGSDATGWRQAVQRACLTWVLREARFDDWLVKGDPRRHAVTLSVHVHNPAARPLFLQVAFPGRPAAADPAVVRVPAHATGTMATTWPAAMCHWVPTALLQPGWSASTTTVLLLRAGVSRFTPPDLIGEDPYRTAVAVPQAQWLVAQIAHACRRAA